MSQTITLNSKAYAWGGFSSQNFASWRFSGGGTVGEFSYLTNKVEAGSSKRASSIRWNLAIPYVATEATACACPGAVLGTDFVKLLVEPSVTSTTASRTDLLARIRSLVLTDEFENSVVNLTQQSSTT